MLLVLAAPKWSEKDTGDDGCVQLFSSEFHRSGVNAGSYVFLQSISFVYDRQFVNITLVVFQQRGDRSGNRLYPPPVIPFQQ